MLFFVCGIIIGVVLVQLFGVFRERELEYEKRNNSVLSKWIDLINDGKSISDILKNQHLNTIAICGFGDIAILLHDSLVQTETIVKYFIDEDGYVFLETAVPGYIPENINFDRLEEFGVDAVIVTEQKAYDKYISKLNNTYKCPILTLEEVLYGE